MSYLGVAYSKVRHDYVKEERTLESKSCLESVAAHTPAPRARASDDEKSTGRKPSLLSLSRSRSNRFHCSAEAKPHQAGEAYRR